MNYVQVKAFEGPNPSPSFFPQPGGKSFGASVSPLVLDCFAKASSGTIGSQAGCLILEVSYAA